MNIQLVHGGGISPYITRRVYYIGTDTLYEGYALCYNFAAADQTPEGLTKTGEGATISLDDSKQPTPARTIQVEKPSWKNAPHFAGVVSNKSNGVTGPCWVEICVPGSVCNIYVNANCDHVEGDTWATGQILSFTTGQYYFKYSGLPGEGSAVILGQTDRSTTAGLVQARLLQGVPSCGVQVIDTTAMLSGAAVSLGGAVGLTAWGITLLDSKLDAGLTVAASPYGIGQGRALGKVPVGAIKQVRVNTTQSIATAFTINASLTFATPSLGWAGSSAADRTNTIGQNANSSITWQWNGTHWVAIHATGAVAT